MLPATTRRVAKHTSQEINERIAKQTECTVAKYASRSPSEIDARLAELDHEWDIERLLEANASTLVLVGTLLAASVNRKWIYLPLVVSSFLLQHAVQGWCPPVPVLRRMGYRTETEINRERYALKVLRGDFEGLPKSGEGVEGNHAKASNILQAVKR
jgi:hypothetical protein